MDSWPTVSSQANGFASKPCSPPIWSSTVMPKPKTKYKWRLCKYARIYRILLWKNWLIRRRSPVLLIAELLFPLLFVLILAAFRLKTPVHAEPACHVQSMSMPSMGLLHYVQSMVCNFNYTCHSQDPVPLTLLPPGTPLFHLIRNLTNLIADHDVRKMVTNFHDGLSLEHIPVLMQAQNTLSSIWSAYETMARDFTVRSTRDTVNMYMDSARQVSRLLCGQKSARENDLGRLITLIESFEAFNVSDFLQHMKLSESSTTASTEDDQADFISPAGRRRAHQINLCGFIEYLLTLNPIVNAAGRLRQFLFGQVVYYPQTVLTDRIIQLASERHQLLVKLQQLCKFYFNSTRPWIEQLFRDPSHLRTFRDQLELCAEDGFFLPENVVHACRMVLSWSSSTTPNISSATHPHWSRTMDSLDFLVGVIESMLDCILVQDKFIPFTNKSDFDAYLEENQMDLLRSPIGLIFERLPFELDNQSQLVRPLSENRSDFISIVLRKSPFLIDTTYRYKVLDYYWTPAPRRNPNTDMKYFTSGFIDLQEDVGRAVMQLLSSASPNAPVQSIIRPGTEFKMFPSAPFVNDGFMDFFAPNLPQLMVLAWSLTVVSAVKYMVDEKEHGLTEMLALLGVPSALIQASWFTVSIILILGSCVPILGILKLTGIVANSNPLLLFCFTMSYAIAILSFAVMCSCFFRRANLAAVASGCVYFIFYLPAPLLLRYENLLSPDVLLGASLLPQVSHSFGWAYFIRLEIHGPGAQWDNLWQGDNADGPYSLGLAFVFLWSSVLLNLTLAVFVIPWVRLGYRWVSPAVTRFLFGPRGQTTYTGWMDALREHRLAAFLRERRLALSVSPDSGHTTGSSLSTPPDSPSILQPETNQPTVVIRQLNKTYRYPHFVALDDVSLNMYPDEITVILGHNGAGKTTLMSILTGTSHQTSGTVLINGFDIRTQMDEVREQMGYCPQRDILYADLTVAEHIRFYSALKGLQDHVLQAKVDAYLDEFNFQSKRNALAKTLSGGQRRKLSVCLAFVGDASVILLDEPTAGVDPLSKRVIWDTIRGMHPGRTVIFTSHHMREAEFLSDHIAILSRGRVCCASSSVSLKAKYGVGYVITVDKCVNEPSQQPSTCSELVSVIRKFIPQATVISDTAHYLKVRIPLEAALIGDDLVQLFRHLELQSLGQCVSITDTSLEDIFIEIMTLTVPDWIDTSSSSSPLLNLGKDLNLGISNGKSNGLGPLLATPSSPSPNGFFSPTLPGLLHHDLDASQSTTTVTTRPESENSSYVLTPGKSFLSQQTAVVCAKRYHHLQRNKILWVLEFLLPCCMVLLSLVLLTLYRPKIDQPTMDLHPWLMTAKREIPLISFIANDVCDSASGDMSPPETGTVFQSLVRNNPWTWTGARCLSRDIYRPRPDDLIRCTRIDALRKQPTIAVNQSYFDRCHAINSSQLLPPVPHYVLPTNDILLNFTHLNIPDYLLHGKLDVSGEMYGGVTVNTIHAQSNASTKAVVELIVALRDWLSLFLWGSNAQNTTNPDIARLFDMNLTTFIRLLLPSGDHFRVWYNNKGYAAAPAYLNLLHNLQLHATSNTSSNEVPSIAMVVANHPLPFPKHTWSFTFRETLKIDAAFALFLLLALSFIPANFVVLLVAERELGIKHLHYVSGLRPHLYWFVNYTWDLLTYTVMSLVCVVFLAIFQKSAFTGPTTVLPFLLIVFLHGCAIIPLIYLTTFVFRQPSTAFVLICAINMMIATITTSISFFLELLTLQEPSLQTLTTRVQFVLRIFPHYCLGSGIYDLSVTRFLTEQGLLPEQTSEATWGLLYPRMLCLVAHTLFFLAVLALLESRSRLKWRWPHPMRTKTAPFAVHWDEDMEETMHMTPGKASLERPPSAIRIRHLSKRYHRQSRPAVNNLNLTVHGGECFGLLGTNGAGKSTTFAMLSGQLAVEPGTVIVNGYDLASQLSQAHRFMGFCPQSDALHDFLTARETLIMYGRLRQLSGAKLQSVVRLLLRATGLEPYANRLVRTYSGGTKRKLSAAIAFIGDPKVILLDEPSSGMDPSARKLLWRLVQSAVHRGCAVVLSSHCMEECETLCNRVGLLVDGQVRCDGGPLELKVRYSVGYLVDLELTHAAIQLDSLELETRLNTLLPGIILRFPLTTRQQYAYSPTDKLSNLFAALQMLREQQLIKHFSVKHSTLEDAFVRCINQTENTALM